MTFTNKTGAGITLSSAVLQHLTEITAATLKVYIYLCRCSDGRPVQKAVPDIMTATGLQRRAVQESLQFLRAKKLIVCTAGTGRQPNTYLIPRAAMSEASGSAPALGNNAPEIPASAVGTSEEILEPAVVAAAGTSTPVEWESVPALAPAADSTKRSDMAGPSPAVPPSRLDQLVARLYRQLTVVEQTDLDERLAANKLTRDEFLNRLVRFSERQVQLGIGPDLGVESNKPLGFFVTAVLQEN